MVLTEIDEISDRARVVVRASRSMSWRGNVLLIVALGTTGIVIASGFTFFGLWLVFPFVGLEILVLTAALYSCLKRLEFKEVITVNAGEVVPERDVRGPEQRFSASRVTTQVNFFRSPNEFSAGVRGNRRINQVRVE